MTDHAEHGTRISVPAQLIKAVIEASLAMHEARTDPPVVASASAAHEAASRDLAAWLAKQEANPVAYAGAGTWDHVDAAAPPASPMSPREQYAIELRTAIDAARRIYLALIAGLRSQLRDRERDLAFEYGARIKAEQRVDALEQAILIHRSETAAGCQVDAALWRILALDN